MIVISMERGQKCSCPRVIQPSVGRSLFVHVASRRLLSDPPSMSNGHTAVGFLELEKVVLFGRGAMSKHVRRC